MSTFTLNRFATPVKVTLTPNITKKQLLSFQAFNSWIDALQANLTLQHDDNGHGFHDNPYVLVGVEIQSVDYFGPSRIGFIKLSAQVRDTRSLISSRSYGVTLPGITLLRGGSVAVLMILRPQDSRDERWVVLVGQPRIPTGSLGFVEIPAGMLDGEGNYAGKAAEEIQEELGFTLQSKDLVNLTELALKHSEPTGETLKDAMYVSPGGSDETVLVLLWEKELYRQEIMDVRAKVENARTRGELVTLIICNYEDMWKVCPRDAKSLAAWALYESLNRAGIIQEELRERKKESMRAPTRETI